MPHISHTARRGAALPHFDGIHRLLAGAALLLVVACVTGRGSSTEKLTHEERLAESMRLKRAELQRLVPRLEAAVRREPEVAKHRFLLGSAYFHTGDLARALPLFEDVAKLDPSEPMASYNAGLVRQLRGDHEAAFRWFQLVVRARPEDWRARAKLVQVAQALGWRRERDENREVLLAMQKAGKVDAPGFCREQFREGRSTVMVFESFGLAGDWPVRYSFEVADDDVRRPPRWIGLGSYAMTTALARRLDALRSGQRLFHLDGYVAGMRHATYAFYEREPAYEEVRARVIEVLRGELGPVSASALEDRRPLAANGPPVKRCVLAINRNPNDDAYVRRVWMELVQLAPAAALDMAGHISVVGPVREDDIGTWLVAAIANSDKTVNIVYTPWDNHTSAESKRDAANGKGTNVTLYFRPDFDPLIPTIQPDGRVVNQRGRPAYISLGHELIHALHMIKGQRAAAIDSRGTPLLDSAGRLTDVNARHTFKNKRAESHTEVGSLEELLTIGLVKRRNKVTENALRQAHHLPLRGAFEPEEAE